MNLFEFVYFQPSKLRLNRSKFSNPPSTFNPSKKGLCGSIIPICPFSQTRITNMHAQICSSWLVYLDDYRLLPTTHVFLVHRMFSSTTATLRLFFPTQPFPPSWSFHRSKSSTKRCLFSSVTVARPSHSNTCGARHGGFHSQGTYPNGWMVFVNGKIPSRNG